MISPFIEIDGPFVGKISIFLLIILFQFFFNNQKSLLEKIYINYFSKREYKFESNITLEIVFVTTEYIQP